MIYRYRYKFDENTDDRFSFGAKLKYYCDTTEVKAILYNENSYDEVFEFLNEKIVLDSTPENICAYLSIIEAPELNIPYDIYENDYILKVEQKEQPHIYWLTERKPANYFFAFPTPIFEKLFERID